MSVVGRLEAFEMRKSAAIYNKAGQELTVQNDFVSFFMGGIGIYTIVLKRVERHYLMMHSTMRGPFTILS